MMNKKNLIVEVFKEEKHDKNKIFTQYISKWNC